MKYYVNLVTPTPTQKRKRITLSQYKKMNPKGFDNLLTRLIKAMVKN